MVPIAIGPAPITKPPSTKLICVTPEREKPMEKFTPKQMTIGGVGIGMIAAAIVGAFQIQDRADDRYVGQEYYAAQSATKAVQSINVQIVQIEIQLEIIEQRKMSRDGDATRHARLLQQLKDLEKAKAELLRK